MALVIIPAMLYAEPVAVKYSEGSVHGFLVLRTTEGKIIASGDLTQFVHGDLVKSRLVFHFKDGSIDDETCTFSQKGNFHLLTDHHVQKGPSYAKAVDFSIDTSEGTVTVRYRDNDKERVEKRHMDLPPDLANGVFINVIKNIVPDGKETKLSWVATTPKPRLVKLSVRSQGEDNFSISGAPYKASLFDVKIEIGGILGIIAPLVGKQPSDIKVWVCEGEAPAFVKSEGPMDFGGPAWSIQLASPSWPDSSR
jgi:hypothetical protein